MEEDVGNLGWRWLWSSGVITVIKHLKVIMEEEMGFFHWHPKGIVRNYKKQILALPLSELTHNEMDFFQW